MYTIITFVAMVMSHDATHIQEELEGYSCKQLLKDPDLTFTLTLKVNILSLVCGFKDKSLRTETVN